MSFRNSIAALALSSVAVVAAGAQGNQHADSAKTKQAAVAQQGGATKPDSAKAKAATKTARHAKHATKAAAKDSTKHS